MEIGRLQLIQSVLFSSQVYWTMHFIRNFLWTDMETYSDSNKVAWAAICLPKKEGGWGLRRIKEWNYVSFLRHIWHICSNF